MEPDDFAVADGDAAGEAMEVVGEVMEATEEVMVDGAAVGAGNTTPKLPNRQKSDDACEVCP